MTKSPSPSASAKATDGKEEILEKLRELVKEYQSPDLISSPDMKDKLFNEFSWIHRFCEWQDERIRRLEGALWQAQNDLHCADTTVGKADLGSRGQTKACIQTALVAINDALSPSP